MVARLVAGMHATYRHNAITSRRCMAVRAAAPTDDPHFQFRGLHRCTVVHTFHTWALSGMRPRRAPRRANGDAIRRDTTMRKEYDFSRARRGPVIPAAKGKT